MARLQKAQSTAANQYKKELSKYKVEDKVWLLTKNIKTKRPLNKLDHKQIRPFKIKKLMESAYRLDLSTLIKIHNVFHPNLLRPVATNPLPDQHNSPPPLVVADKEEKKRQKIDDIIDAKKGQGGKILFQVKWKKYNKDKQ